MSSPQPCQGAKKCSFVSAGQRCSGIDSAAADAESEQEPEPDPGVVPVVLSEWGLGKMSGKWECLLLVTGGAREEGAKSVWDVCGSVTCV